MAASAGDDYVLRPTVVQLKTVALVILALAFPVAACRIDAEINPSECGELEPTGRIYNGDPVTKENIPWMVAVFSKDRSAKGSGLCGGSIITRNVILTAAHCVVRKGRYVEKVAVMYNFTLDGKFTGVRAHKIIAHPRFVKRDEIVHDVALVKLPVDLEFHRFMKPVCLPTHKMDVAGKILVVAGWGRTEWGNTSKSLRRAEVVGLTDELCQDELRTVRNRKHATPGPVICAFGIGTGACRGESGGPLTLRGDDGKTLQLGIVAAGKDECPPSRPPFYARVSSHIEWIEKALNNVRMWGKYRLDRKEFSVRLP
ncbi:chymotrypsinogen A-like [Dermacentor andersoni]|uniref:chymotrypsinogen A-like n=1 Tax=Dermacentor andersoni TaxID=34620 RepID=UPI002415B5BB|nr:chymotrypsinogen A-like [Dermacentor andersoni]